MTVGRRLTFLKEGEVEEALSRVPDTILDISNNGYPGLSMETNSSENVFDIEVETLLNQAPTVSLSPNRHKYNSLMDPGRSNSRNGTTSTIVKEACGFELSQSLSKARRLLYSLPVPRTRRHSLSSGIKAERARYEMPTTVAWWSTGLTGGRRVPSPMHWKPTALPLAPCLTVSITSVGCVSRICPLWTSGMCPHRVTILQSSSAGLQIDGLER